MRSTLCQDSRAHSMARRLFAAAVVLGVAAGIVGGVGCYTFLYARGASYLTNNPAACANCHVMREQYDGWLKSSHHGVAVCNDCHTPRSLVGKYVTKGINGWNHSLAFTTQRFHEPIRIGPRNLAITEAACRSCHTAIVEQIDSGCGRGRDALSCVRCHPSVGHLH